MTKPQASQERYKELSKLQEQIKSAIEKGLPQHLNVDFLKVLQLANIFFTSKKDEPNKAGEFAFKGIDEIAQKFDTTLLKDIQKSIKDTAKSLSAKSDELPWLVKFLPKSYGSGGD